MLKQLDPFIGDLPLGQDSYGDACSPSLRSGNLQGVKKRTINYALQTVRHILNLAAAEWIDEYGQTWLASAPKIKLLKEDDKRDPYPLVLGRAVALVQCTSRRTWHRWLCSRSTRDAVNRKFVSLRWDWEQIFRNLTPACSSFRGSRVKNREDRLVVLNKVAEAVIEERRGQTSGVGLH